ncbi:MAG: Surface adhesion protein, partial [Actinobacteria bacterium]|nr:Surface adhesion protein [Actinomycetota bacterium]
EEKPEEKPEEKVEEMVEEKPIIKMVPPEEVQVEKTPLQKAKRRRFVI